MDIFSRLSISALVIRCALFPGQKRGKPPCAPSPLDGFISLSPGDIPFYLADLRQSLDHEGRLALFFPGCLAAAAPFLLFRLKRTGFSRCRVKITDKGLFLTACR